MTLSGLAAALWTRSPRDIVAAARRRLQDSPVAPGARGDVAQGYHAWLVDELYEFVAGRYPGDVLARDRFRTLVAKYQDPAWLKASNRYIGDLWYLFAPDFQQRLGDYYAQQDLQLTATLLSYAANPALLDANYVRPYAMARERLARPAILELGAGLPHGFLSNVHQHGSSWCAQLVSADIDGTPAAFLRWFCARKGIAHRAITAAAGVTPDLQGVAGVDFVFAKDVFEHLVDPDRAIDRLLACLSPRAVLALDLDDKGAVEYQHVSPTLQPLARRVEQAGFRPITHTGNLSMYSRG